MILILISKFFNNYFLEIINFPQENAPHVMDRNITPGMQAGGIGSVPSMTVRPGRIHHPYTIHIRRPFFLSPRLRKSFRFKIESETFSFLATETIDDIAPIWAIGSYALRGKRRDVGGIRETLSFNSDPVVV